MKQIHKKFCVDQVRLFFSAYLKRRMSREEVEQELEIEKSRFFVLLKHYRQNPDNFSIDYHRSTPKKPTYKQECAIQDCLRFDRELIDTPDIPISSYNYSAIRDRLIEKQNIVVSVPTIIARAKEIGCYQAKKPKKAHDREVLTTAIGMLVQHYASHHLWSPYATKKWTLITSLDDLSRKILYADFVLSETTWVHIEAVEAVVAGYGLPLRYYVDQLRVFRFIQGKRQHLEKTYPAD